jgi:hypothetical protein
MYGLLDIQDRLQRQRLERLLGIPLPLKKH